MSDLTIDLANYIVENESSVSFEEAHDLVMNMDEDSMGAMMEEMGL